MTQRLEKEATDPYLVPVDDVIGHDERFDVDDINVSSLRPDVQPFALFGKKKKEVNWSCSQFPAVR